MNNLLQIAIAIDQLLNTLLGGMSDETLSARAYRQALKGNTLPNKIIDFLFFWQKEHCYNAWLSEVKRKQLPKDYQ